MSASMSGDIIVIVKHYQVFTQTWNLNMTLAMSGSKAV